MDAYKILKFLFPEYQIVEAAKQHGFIARGKKKDAAPSNSTVNKQSIPSNETQRARNEMISSPKQPADRDISNANTVSYPEKKEIQLTGSQVDAGIRNAKDFVHHRFIGQNEAIENLFLAFKRPFVTGVQTDKPRNTIIVSGSDSSGKRMLVNTSVQALYREKMLNAETVTEIDLSLYPTQAENLLFMADLYEALSADSDVISFEGVQNCHESILDTISDLVMSGMHRLDARYTVQNRNLVEATGVLMQNSIGEIFANNKYFVFLTQSPSSSISKLFGAKFMENVADVITFVPYEEAEISAIVEVMLGNLDAHCKKQLSFTTGYAKEFLQLCVSKYKKSTGLKTIEEYIWKDIYHALSEYKLRNSVSADTTVYLNYLEGTIYATVTENGASRAVDMTPYLGKIDTTNIEEVKKELANVIGLTKVKEYVLDLENHFKVQQMREDAGFKNAPLSMHMIFTGNPGTGKTTIARIVAKYLKEIGVLSTGQLREVSRADLVGQYVGHTAKQTNEVIQSALGGVLFIDEAYALCRDKNDTFGLEAIDTLVKAIEDHRDDFVVILAGYQDEMQGFLEVNSGLKSRFPNIIDFEDYTAEEMVRIADITVQAKGYRIADDCREPLERLFEKSQIKGRNDGGNGRLVRNVVESAILKQSKRIGSAADAAYDLLKKEDFQFEDFESFDLDKALGVIIGLDQVKDFVRTQYQLLVAAEKRRKAGVIVDSTQSLNMIFTGNPGTGKTTIARVVASMFKDMGLLKKGHLVETDRGDFVSEYVGQTAQKTEKVFLSALGGVLFIDEAYALGNDKGGFGKEAIDTLVKLMEDYRGELVVILAGYRKEMSDFMNSNSGLESRFPLVIDFPDYKPDELYAIALRIISTKGFTITEEAMHVLNEQLILAHKLSTTHSGNGRMVRNKIEEIMRKQFSRIASAERISKEGLTEILPEDIVENDARAENFNLEKMLSSVVGLEEVKNYIRSLYARLRMQAERKKMGLPTDSTQTLHMIFSGNPGTGKTMIARTVADVLANIGVIQTNKLIETDRAGLVAGYVGQTAIKTTEKVMQAMDGVLFIDEAYALAQGGETDFGREAIDTIVKLMDDNRERLVVILAGYSKNMDDFLQMNPGLESRFPNQIEFPDYTVDELLVIAENLYVSKGYTLGKDAKVKLASIFEKAIQETSFGNGRYVRNVFERSINKQSLRLSTDPDLTREELITVEAVDIEEV